MTVSPDYTLVYAKHTGIEGLGQMPRSATVDSDWVEVSTVEDAVAAPVLNPADLRGSSLDDALDSADLPKSGTVAEKQARLADHQALLSP